MTVPVQTLNREIEVWRRIFVEDESGGRSAVWNYMSTERTRIMQPSIDQQLVAAQAGAQLTHIAYFLPTVDILRGDELRGENQVLSIWAVSTPSEPVYLRANCEELDVENE